MEVSDFAPILVQIIFASVLAGVIILASHFLGQRSRKNSIKDSAYECGIKSEGKTSTRFSVKFYVTAMLFILFDIEVLFLIPWALIYRDFLAEGLPILGPIMFFLAVLVIGLVYEIRKGGLEWEK
ncbi:MAG: NADH-quinone oxidoreductase subunit A [Opitutales bacterium]|jgi:NADH-quinone oxidoreductase subunit A|nr:NADH-quinone oxidoreductase subunit A [Opitutales bacterium]|tara:strand:- start:425 stop:799 length:375 start_codon:yes stop_codon:yes gene_type:complete